MLGLLNIFVYSHSIVAGGLEVISSTIRLTCLTSFKIRVETFSRATKGIIDKTDVLNTVVVDPGGATL